LNRRCLKPPNVAYSAIGGGAYPQAALIKESTSVFFHTSATKPEPVDRGVGIPRWLRRVLFPNNVPRAGLREDDC